MTTATIRIESIADGGDGVGRTDGMVVFVPRSAPGDLVRVAVAGKKRFGRGRILAIDQPSASRIDPPCPHYAGDRCGGCQIQHIDYSAQLAAKSSIIRDGITRLGKRAIEAPSVEASPSQWRYRSKLTLAIRAGTANRPATIGLHPFDDPTAVFQLRDCPITDERVVSVWRTLMKHAGDFPANATRGSVRIAGDGSAAVVIEGGTSWPGGRRLFDAVPAIASLWWKPDNRARELVASRSDAADAASFAQVNTLMAAALHAHTLDRIGRHQAATAVDAYAGSGATAIPLAQSGVRVTAIELDRHAAEVCGSRLPAGSRSLVGRVEDLLPSVLPADVVLLNPPRTGLDEAIPAALESVSSRPKAIVYVSCNPATLGRDLARLPSYRVASVRGFDMFPQTAHVETVCELVPEAA